MKYLHEYRTPEAVLRYAEVLARLTTRAWTIMEVCGGQTHAIVRFGVDALLPPGLTLVHGPGCPVCVTPVAILDHAMALVRQPEIILCSFGDMLRVPGSQEDLLSAKARGGDVRIVYSPLDALALARQHPHRQVVFLAVGFETTAPANALAVVQAQREGLRNFSLLVSHVLVPPAMAAILQAPHNRVQGFLAAGHVCTVMGYTAYEPLAQRYGVPIVVTGFEPLDLLQGITMCVAQLEQGQARVENQYARVVQRQGNVAAQRLIQEVFTVKSQNWRGIGIIPDSGWQLREAYAAFDAARRFPCILAPHQEDAGCISGLVLQGVKKPYECPAFRTRCTPEQPLGATMVSSEGACAAYYRYRRSAPTG